MQLITKLKLATDRILFREIKHCHELMGGGVVMLCTILDVLISRSVTQTSTCHGICHHCLLNVARTCSRWFSVVRRRELCTIASIETRMIWILKKMQKIL